MGFVKEFREFAMRGNLVDMAIAFVMGGAFGRVVSGFNDGIVMPIVGMLTTGVDLSKMKIILARAEYNAAGEIVTPETAVRYGEFITIFINFLLVAAAMFLLVRTMNRIRKKQEEAPPPPKTPELTMDQKLLTEIRDALKNR